MWSVVPDVPFSRAVEVTFRTPDRAIAAEGLIDVESSACGALGLSTMKCRSRIKLLTLFPRATGVKYNMLQYPGQSGDDGPMLNRADSSFIEVTFAVIADRGVPPPAAQTGRARPDPAGNTPPHDCHPVIAWMLSDRGQSARVWGWRRYSNLKKRLRKVPLLIFGHHSNSGCAPGAMKVCALIELLKVNIRRVDQLIHVHSPEQHAMFWSGICPDVDRRGPGRVRHGKGQSMGKVARSGFPRECRLVLRCRCGKLPCAGF